MRREVSEKNDPVYYFVRNMFSNVLEICYDLFRAKKIAYNRSTSINTILTFEAIE